MRYYVLHNKRQYGPFDETEIRELLSAGILTFNDLVAPEGTLKFQSLAKTDLIFTDPAGNLPPCPFPTKAQAEIAHDETAATHFTEVAAQAPGQSTEITEQIIFGINPEKTFKRRLGFAMRKLIARLPWRKTLAGKTIKIFVSHIYDWLLVLTVTLTMQGFLFSKTFSAIFRLLFPAPGDPIGVSFTGQVVEMTIVAIITLYTSSMAILIAILGAASRDSHRFFNYKLLFRKAHRKLPVFWVMAINFAIIYLATVMSAILLPNRIESFGKYAAEVIFLLATYRLFAVPFVVILENIGLTEAYRISFKLLKNQFKPVFCAGLVYIALHTTIRLSIRKWPFGVALTHLLQLFTIIYATYYYQQLSSIALIQRKRIE